jgi:hypothetical protein
MLVQRYHIRRQRKRGERDKTLCGLLIDSPRECLVNESGSHERKKPKIVSPQQLWDASLIYHCSKCFAATFGWGSGTEWWLQSDERKEYEAKMGARRVAK